MRKRIRGMLSALLVTLPLVFVMAFLGYFRVHYDLVLFTDNVAGEGICKTYGSVLDGRTMPDETLFYFGSELKKATIQGNNYDLDTVHLITYDVSSYDIKGIESWYRSLRLRHFEPADIVPEGKTAETTSVRLSSENGAVHVDVLEPAEGARILISKNYIPLWFWILYFALVLIAAVVLAFFVSFLFERVPALKLPLMSAACVTVALLAGCWFCGSLPYITYVNFVLNWAILTALALALNALTLPFLGTLVTMAFTTLAYIANYYVILFRGKPIMPPDLKAIGTAAEVAGGYDFTPSWKLLVGFALVAGYAVILILIWKKERPTEKPPLKKALIRRGATLAAAALLFVLCVNTKPFKSINTFAWDTAQMRSFYEDGMVLSFLHSAYNARVREPEGYSRELVQQYLEEYRAQPAPEKDGVRPTRIIMVMNEAFSDLRTVGLNPQIDVMPFIDSLQENTVEGSLFVSIIGGGTCNTEFEALTGNTLAFLGAGAYPYTEYVMEPRFSLARYFTNLDYLSEAFHANLAANWNRDRAYPNLGFEAFHSLKDYVDFGEITYLHDHPADISDYRYIEAVDAANAGRGRFLFNVTMQNHSSYESWLDVERAPSVMEYGSDLYVDTQVYLSLIQASDDEVRQLVETYKDSEEPTMIVFFGDHEPGLPGAAMNELYSDVKSNLDFYKSKFFIWTNYETQAWHNAGLSANYLFWLVLERGNFPLPPFAQMLAELYAHYPIISSQGVMDIEGNIYDSVADVMDDPLIRKYQYIQYANLFDELDPAWFEVE